MASPTLSAAQAADLAAMLRDGGLPDDPAALIDLIGELEKLKSLACAVQADGAVAYVAARRSVESAQGVSARRQGRGVAAEIALARSESPHRGQTLFGLAKILHLEMPHADNGQGMCEACNHAKQAPGWRQSTVDDLRHSVETVPSGHRYRSTAPPPVGWREPRWVRDDIFGEPGVYTLVA
jgi:hypothetical protein